MDAARKYLRTKIYCRVFGHRSLLKPLNPSHWIGRKLEILALIISAIVHDLEVAILLLRSAV